MDLDKIKKLENVARIAELNPVDTLSRAGFKEGMTLCDIGAGSGVFSFPAAEISKNNIYALEVSEQMIELLVQRKGERNINNLVIRKVVSDILPMENNCCDMVVMVTVLHELDNKEFMLHEIKRILKQSGKLMIIEFHKRKTPMGPPVDIRLDQEYVDKMCSKNGLNVLYQNSLGDNFYISIFEKTLIPDHG